MTSRLFSWALHFLLISSVFFCGCLSDTERDGSGSNIQMHLTEIEQTAIDNNRFALDMYRELAGKEENVFFSPWSLNSALSMTYEGARDETAEEIRSVLHFSENVTLEGSYLSALDKRINDNNLGFILSTANAIWVDKDISLIKEYADVVEGYYHSKADNVDFKDTPDDARQTINTWVEQKTADKIKDLIPPNYVDHLTRLVLTNAIYFKGAWVKEFDRTKTWNDIFITGDGRTVTVPMMKRLDEEARFNYLEKRDMQMLQMQYKGENISLLILLPKEHDIVPLEKSLTVDKLDQWKRDLKEQRVDVYIPKFKINANYFLAKNLTKMGMPTAFAEMADLSGISTGKGLFISEVIHQAFIDVDEKGTEAAAATAVLTKEGLSQDTDQMAPIFRADHPFLFLIEDKETNCILFMGKFSDPSKN